METLGSIGTVIYFTMLVGLSCYGLHRYWMIFLYYRHRKDTIQPAGTFATLPKVTVQLPLYNEMYVAERLIDAVVALDYPRPLLEIQVLDDSTDETRNIVAQKVSLLQEQGIDIEHIHRIDRTGYKAGALQNGLQTATGELVAIFDADFVPQSELLQRMVHHFTDPKVGMVQARWGHLNEDHSLLTRVQSMLLDAHFMIEHTARSRSGRFFNFNGTAGIWRRSCISDAGGWDHDTLAEDLDLSYRAQLRGWRFVYLSDLVVPAELPVEMNAFKNQQHRWAKGSAQTCKKMFPVIWRSKLPWKVKFEGMVHLTSNFAYVMLLLLCLTFRAAVPAMDQQFWAVNPIAKLLLFDVPLFLAASASVLFFYMCAQRELYPRWWKRLLYFPALMAVGIGLSVNNARAVLEALFNHRSEFIRTPKYGSQSSPRTNRYRAFRGLMPFFELAMGVYFADLLLDFVRQGNWAVLPFIGVMLAGFVYVGFMSLAQTTWLRLARVSEPELAPAGA